MLLPIGIESKEKCMIGESWNVNGKRNSIRKGWLAMDAIGKSTVDGNDDSPTLIRSESITTRMIDGTKPTLLFPISGCIVNELMIIDIRAHVLLLTAGGTLTSRMIEDNDHIHILQPITSATIGTTA